ncbi:hypothetical protein J23TS9_32170 [Paenibacillus sp. J23TS9]|nr:hypothetical protein J23TS9_32170 [Paenibacillus sp. J23TS9]
MKQRGGKHRAQQNAQSTGYNDNKFEACRIELPLSPERADILIQTKREQKRK